MSDWTTARVVRDQDGSTLMHIGSGFWMSDAGVTFDQLELEPLLGPLTPILDADGLPVVRTVGDLTARHIGRRVRVGGADPAVLNSLSVRSGMYVPEVIISTGLSGGFYITLDTPCELLPEGDA